MTDEGAGTLRIAHFTDLHLRWHLAGTSSIAKRRSRDMPELFGRALEAARAAGAECLAVTGDLLDVPSYILEGDDYYDYQPETWEAEAEADYALLRDLLEGTGLPYLALPGNHDWIRPMARVFGPANAVLDVGGYRLATFWDREAAAHVPRRLDRERNHLLALLADGSGRPQIHLQHYLITPILNDGWPYSYYEGDELRRRLVESGKVAAALCGHRHSGWEPVREGRCTFACGRGFCAFPHPWQLVEVRGFAVEVTEKHTLSEPLQAGRPAVFLDRDGVLNEQPWWRSGPEDLQPVAGAGAALRALREAGFALIAISSQSCVGAGYLTPDRVDAGFDKLARAFQRAGGWWDAQYYSTGAGAHAVHVDLEPNPHGKPKPDYALQAAELLGLDLARSWFIGDNLSDLQAGLAAGARPVLVRTGHGEQNVGRLSEHPELGATLIAEDLPAAVAAILRAAAPPGGR